MPLKVVFLGRSAISAADANLEVVIDFYDLAHRVVLSKKRRGQRLGDQHGRRVLCGVAAAVQHPEAKHPGKIGLRYKTGAGDGFAAVVEKAVAGAM